MIYNNTQIILFLNSVFISLYDNNQSISHYLLFTYIYELTTKSSIFPVKLENENEF